MTKARMALCIAAVAALAASAGLGLRASSAEAIYNGDVRPWAQAGEMAQIHGLSQKTGKWGQLCGATRIDDSWVLTAAHCATDDVTSYGCEGFRDRNERNPCYVYANRRMALHMDWKPAPASERRVRLASGVERSVAEVLVYPAYTSVYSTGDREWADHECLWWCAQIKGLSYVSGDVALLRLAEPVEGLPHARLASSEQLTTDGRQVQALGWGDTDHGRDRRPSTDLRATRPGSYELMSPPTLPGCNPGAPDASQVMPGMVLCARSVPSTPGTGTGAGDSGGPLFTTDADGALTQVGVTSYGSATGYARKSQPSHYASVGRTIRWIHSKTGVGQGAASSGESVATALVIDNSGSMSSSDPDALRRQAAKSYVTTAVPGDHVGAVGFESSSKIISAMAQLPAGAAALSAALDGGIFDGGLTDIGAGLAAGCALLDDAALPARRAAVLLTDGDGDYAEEAACFASRGWKVFTIGLGEDANETLLREIAERTGGAYQQVPAPQNLLCEFQKIRAQVAGAQPAPCESDVIGAGQTLSKTMNVAARTAQVVFSTQWPGSDVQMTLVTPSGRRIVRGSSDWDVTHSASGTHETFVVRVPEPGEWKVELFGADVPAGGEPVVFGASQVPFGNQLPLLAASASRERGKAPVTVILRANAADPDGTVSDVLWDFGDGSAGRGQTVTHTYRNPGSYAPTVTAVDNVGEPASATLAPVIVAGKLPKARFSSRARGATVTVDASKSRDPDGKLAGYAWDFNGDGSLDATGIRARFTYAKAGRHTITASVRTRSRKQAVARRVVRVRRGQGPSVSNLSLTRRGIAVRVRCAGRATCRGRLELAVRPRRVRAAFSVRAGRARTVTIALPRSRQSGAFELRTFRAGWGAAIDVHRGTMAGGRVTGRDR